MARIATDKLQNTAEINVVVLVHANSLAPYVIVL